MSDRTRPADRRDCEVVDFEFANIVYCGKFSRFADGSIAEVFLDAMSVKSTSPIAAVSHAMAVLASIAIQHGASLEEIRHGLPRVDLPNGETEAGDPLGQLLELFRTEPRQPDAA